MRVAILGGDGFVGWPVALHLSSRGHAVAIIDNLSRRTIDAELKVQSLTPIATPQERIQAWKEVSGCELHFELLDIAEEYGRLWYWLQQWQPETVIHFAEQRAAPYSMKSARHKRYTINNNINGTHNVLCALAELRLDAHLVHLGSTGVYGYGTAGVPIPEGYLNVEITLNSGDKVEREILYPANPGSVYHATKCMDQQIFAYYAKNDELRITDLHQGIVWGTNTDESLRDERLINRFDYDGDYGTVLNRLLMQAAIGYPLTVHGTGGQTRAFIHIQDSVRCIELAIQHPPERGDRVKVFNQMTECHRIIDLARIIQELTGAEINMVPNPRREDATNELEMKNEQFLSLGLEPTLLQEGLLTETVDVVQRYRDRVDISCIPCTSAWTAEIAEQLKDHRLAASA